MTAIHLPPGSPSGQNLDPSTLRAQLSANKLAALLPSSAANGATVQDPQGTTTQGAQAAGRSQPALPAGPNLPVGSTRETLSFAARTILGLLGQGESGPLRTAGPLLALPPTRLANSAQQVQHALMSLVQDSGLFYESHLAQWVSGQRGLASMAREPQAAIGRGPYSAASGMPAGSTGADPAGATLSGLLARAPSGSGPGAMPAALPSPSLPGEMPGSAAPASGPPLDAATADARLAAQAAVPGSLSSLAAQSNPPGAARPVLPGDPSAEEPASGTARPDGASRGAELPRSLQSAAQAYQSAASDAARLAAAQSSLQVMADPDTAARPEPGITRSEAAPVIHPDTEGIVRQQLELLATHQFRWAGEAWPGTPMQWEVTDQRPEQEAESAGDQSEGNGERSWSSRLVLELPQLGTVEARLTLTGNGLETRLVVQEDYVARMLDSAQDGLRNGLGARGIDLLHFSIRGDGGPEGMA